MDNAGYIALTRQSGLLQEMQSVANNIANASTTGFRREGTAFTEFVVGDGVSRDGLSMARLNAHYVDLSLGPLTETGGSLDVAIDGGGYFLVNGAAGQELTRAGSFVVSPAGELMTPDRRIVLDTGEAPVFIPPDANDIAIAADGTISTGGQVIGQIGLFQPADPLLVTRASGTSFSTTGVVPVENPRMVQGFLETSNVNAVQELTRMIEVQRAYEMGQKLLDQEHERIRNVIRTVTK